MDLRCTHKLVFLGLTFATLLGCNSKNSSSDFSNIDTYGYESQFNRMVHSAEMADMVITDVHFLPGRAILNSTGTRRLAHLGWIIDRYGGTIYLDFDENTGSALSEARKKVVFDYLVKLGVNKDKIKLAFGLPATEGMPADEAMSIYKKSRSTSEELK